MILPVLALAVMHQLPPTANRGADLYQKCLADVRLMDKTEKPSDLDDANTCMDYIQGFQAALALADAPVCAESGTLGTLVRVYVDYMQKHPKMMDREKALGVYGALLAAYPCPQK